MNERFMQLSIELALEGIEKKGFGPFGAVVVKGDEVLGAGSNMVTTSYDPTAHAEISAIRQACFRLKDFSLKGCDIYTSCEPCPMCLGAIYWARLDRVYFGATREDAAMVNFDDRHFYEEIGKPLPERTIPMIQLMRSSCLKLFEVWALSETRIAY